MIVLLETVHPEALALLESADVVRLMAVPTAIDDDVLLDEVRAVLTRRSRTDHGRDVQSLAEPSRRRPVRCRPGQHRRGRCRVVGNRRRACTRPHDTCGQ